MSCDKCQLVNWAGGYFQRLEWVSCSIKEHRGDARTHNHTKGRHGTVFRCTKAVPWVQLRAWWSLVVISGVAVHRRAERSQENQSCWLVFKNPKVWQKNMQASSWECCRWVQLLSLRAVWCFCSRNKEWSRDVCLCVCRSFIAEMQLFVKQLGRSKTPEHFLLNAEVVLDDQQWKRSEQDAERALQTKMATTPDSVRACPRRIRFLLVCSRINTGWKSYRNCDKCDQKPWNTSCFLLFVWVKRCRVCSAGITAREHGSNKKLAAQSCALSLVRQLYHLGVIEAYSGVTKKKEGETVRLKTGRDWTTHHAARF